MCGRYVVTVKPQQLAIDFGAADEVGQYPPDFNGYNVAPTTQVPAVLVRDGARALTTVRWGLVPFWAKDVSIGSRMFNARVETIAEKGVFKSAYAKRRCLLPADGYYEWLKAEPKAGPEAAGGGRKPKPRKQPFYIHAQDGGVLAFAGVYERWRDPDGAWLWSASIVTGAAASGALSRVHDRMPLTVHRDGWEAWLDPELTDPDAVHSLLDFTPQWSLRPVGDAVNAVRNTGLELVQPVPLEADIAREVADAAAEPDALPVVVEAGGTARASDAGKPAEAGDAGMRAQGTLF